MTDPFLAYVRPPDLHDGLIEHVSTGGDTITVSVHGSSGRRFGLVFRGVSSHHAVEPEGMMLYALVELQAPGPQRKFVFANWDDEDGSELSIVAGGFEVQDHGQDALPSSWRHSALMSRRQYGRFYMAGPQPPTGRRVCGAVFRGETILMVEHCHDFRTYWTLPDGGVEAGGTDPQAVLREMLEETGLTGTVVPCSLPGRTCGMRRRNP